MNAIANRFAFASRYARMLGCVAMLALAACATPAQRIDAYASAHDLARIEVSGGPYQLVTYVNAGARNLRATISAAPRVLHVYLEGDGLPWNDAKHVADDPTTRDPLALRLMAQDSAPSVYLARPCYQGLAHAPECTPLMWTHARYGLAVVERMVAALQRVIADTGHPRVVLIGYSGGGVIAMSMAARIPETSGVITVAANLDIDAWAKLHDHSPLAGSLNPAREAPLLPSITQWHLVGAQDENVPYWLVRGAVAPAVAVELFDNFDHACCWEEAWPRILDAAERRLNQPRL